MTPVRVAITACLLTCAVAGALPATGHPVAQGSLAVVVGPDLVSVRATVSTEEVLVAAALGGPGDSSSLARQRGHGEYLLAHLRVSADGRPLSGRVMSVSNTAAGRPTYELEYLAPGGASTRIVLEQDVLREFEFQPGNAWEATYVVRIDLPGGTFRDGLLLTSRQPLVVDVGERRGGGAISPRVQAIHMVRDYLRHGIAHILAGYDHLLFIVALALAAATWWDLVKVVSVFTVAHSITLALAVLNVVRIPSGLVEPMIAASIVAVALPNVLAPGRGRGAARLAVAFVFGLFHGLGFAGGLLTAMEGMTGAAVGVAIASFSAGVEVGHQLVVLPVFALLAWLRRQPGSRLASIRQRLLQYASAGISVAGLSYLLEALR
jgi:hydrogenase/urease accessory protein HupE